MDLQAGIMSSRMLLRMINYISHCCDDIRGESNLREKSYIGSQFTETQSAMAEKAPFTQMQSREW